MRKSAIFRSLCLVMTWVYFTVAVTVQAGQVVTSDEKAWAKEAVKLAKSEKKMAPISAANTLAVLYFNNKTGLEDMNNLQKGMAIMLITDLAKVPELQVVERIKVQALLDEMELGTSGLADQATAPKVGKLLGTYYVANGDIALGKMAKLNIKPVVIDVPFGTVTTQTAASGNLEDLFRMEKEILFGIIDQMKIFLTPKERNELNKPFAATSAAALAFFAAINLSDKGSYVEAASFYEKAIAEDQNFTLAKDALGELKTLGLVKSATTATTSPAPTKAPDEGLSTGTIVLITLGVLAVGGGVAALAFSGGSDKTTTSTGWLTANSGQSANCNGRSSLNFTSSRALIAQSCSASFGTPSPWLLGNVTTKDTSVSVNYYYSSSTSTSCTSGTAMALTISNCRDNSGNTMPSQSFNFTTP